MNVPVSLFLVFFTLFYGLMCFYVYRRVAFGLRRRTQIVLRIVAFGLFLVPFLRLLRPGWGENLEILGGWWLGWLTYFVLSLLLLEAGCLLLKRPWRRRLTFAAALLALAIFAYGWNQARHPVVQPYEVTIAKEFPGRESLTIAMVSDVHIGALIDRGRVEELVQQLNAQQADLIVLVGDTIDQDADYLPRHGIPQVLRGLKAPLGVYAIMGNHEYISRKPEKAIKYLEAGGLTVLRDRWQLVGNGLVLVGRDDFGRSRYQPGESDPLEDILAGVDLTRPVVVMDHQPRRIDEAAVAGADVLLSGHTHQGQMWPISLITHAMYELDWGMLQRGNMTMIVSSGYGGWGPPLRVGTQSEIVLLKLHFAGNAVERSGVNKQE